MISTATGHLSLRLYLFCSLLLFILLPHSELPAIDEYATIARTAIALKGEEETNAKSIADQTRVIDNEC